jgi:predicted amidophosphoribosyltransferase
MRLSQLQFSSLLSYCPKGGSGEADKSKDVMLALKSDTFVDDPPLLMSQWIANTLKQNKDRLAFSSYFQDDAILVPIPKSSLMQPNTLWVPERIAAAIVRTGLAKKVLPGLSRIASVPKAATSLAKDRPNPADHYRTISVQKPLDQPSKIILVDDIITRGSTLLGAANRLADVFPRTPIYAFAAIRTVSNPNEFKKIYDPCSGTITLRDSGDTLRRP